jgi:hypothetical protein
MHHALRYFRCSDKDSLATSWIDRSIFDADQGPRAETGGIDDQGHFANTRYIESLIKGSQAFTLYRYSEIPGGLTEICQILGRVNDVGGERVTKGYALG